MTESTHSQSLTESQLDILSYWMSLQSEAPIPLRGSFDPGAVLRYLRDITVLELTSAGAVNCRVSSASQASRMPKEALSSLRTLGLKRLLDEHTPVHGQREVGQGTHYWLRLPLLSDCASRLLILCHDEFVHERVQTQDKSRDSVGFSPQSAAIAA